MLWYYGCCQQHTTPGIPSASVSCDDIGLHLLCWLAGAGAAYSCRRDFMIYYLRRLLIENDDKNFALYSPCQMST